jgi:hypothetical protein
VIALRMALAAAAAGALLAAGAWAGGAFARAGPASTDARPAGEIPVGDDLEVSGQPMRLSLFYTADPPATVIAFYADAFRARGLLPVRSAADAPAHVSVFDPADGLQRFVSALPQPDGRTLVLTGAVDPSRPAQLLPSAATVTVPLPPGHRALLAFRSRDRAARAESAQFLSPMSTGEVARFYRQALASDGYVERGGTGDGLLLFGKPGANLSVAVRPLDARAGAAVFLTRIEGDPR